MPNAMRFHWIDSIGAATFGAGLALWDRAPSMPLWRYVFVAALCGVSTGLLYDMLHRFAAFLRDCYALRETWDRDAAREIALLWGVLAVPRRLRMKREAEQQVALMQSAMDQWPCNLGWTSERPPAA